MNRVKVAVFGRGAVGVLPAGCATEPKSSTSYVPDFVNRVADDSGGSVPPVTKLPDLKAGAELPDLLAYAALNNPGLEAAFHRWKAALERVPQAKSLPDPRFTYRYFIEEVETRVGAQRQRFAIAQTFPWFGKLKLQGRNLVLYPTGLILRGDIDPLGPLGLDKLF